MCAVRRGDPASATPRAVSLSPACACGWFLPGDKLQPHTHYCRPYTNWFGGVLVFAAAAQAAPGAKWPRGAVPCGSRTCWVLGGWVSGGCPPL